MRVKVPSGKKTTECSLAGAAQHAARIGGAAVPVETLDELRAQALQQRTGEGHVCHLALDDEAKLRRQRRGEHDAVEVACVIADHHALARRQVLGEAHGERQPREHAETARASGARGRAPLRQARQHDQQGERDQADGRESSRISHSAYSTRSGARHEGPVTWRAASQSLVAHERRRMRGCELVLFMLMRGR